MAMTGRTNRTLTLDEVAARFESWRQNRQGKAPIPAVLWSAAVAVARNEGVNRTSARLPLEWNQLKRRMTTTGAVSRPPAHFVELMVPRTESQQECLIEMEGRRGKLRIHLSGTTSADLANLSRTLW